MFPADSAQCHLLHGTEQLNGHQVQYCMYRLLPPSRGKKGHSSKAISENKPDQTKMRVLDNLHKRQGLRIENNWELIIWKNNIETKGVSVLPSPSLYYLPVLSLM